MARTDIFHSDEGTVGKFVSGRDLPDMSLDTLLAWGMPNDVTRACIAIDGDVVAKKYGEKFSTYGIMYFGVLASESQIDTGFRLEVHADTGQKDEMIVWQRRIHWVYAKAFFHTIYNLHKQKWVMYVSNIESDPEDERIGIIKKLAEGMMLGSASHVTIKHKRGGDQKSKFKWTDAKLLEFRSTYYDETLPAFENAEKFCKVAGMSQGTKQKVLTMYRDEIDADLAGALFQAIGGKGQDTAARLALEQAARRVGVGKGDYKPGSLPTYLTRANRLYIQSNLKSKA